MWRENAGQQALRRGPEDGQAGDVLSLTGSAYWPVSLPSKRGLSGNRGILGSQSRVKCSWDPKEQSGAIKCWAVGTSIGLKRQQGFGPGQMVSA